VVSVYEAGCDNFWLHRALTAAGVENRVIDAASVPMMIRLGSYDSNRGLPCDATSPFNRSDAKQRGSHQDEKSVTQDASDKGREHGPYLQVWTLSALHLGNRRARWPQDQPSITNINASFRIGRDGDSEAFDEIFPEAPYTPDLSAELGVEGRPSHLSILR
jgi:hypothetical protein